MSWSKVIFVCQVKRSKNCIGSSRFELSLTNSLEWNAMWKVAVICFICYLSLSRVLKYMNCFFPRLVSENSIHPWYFHYNWCCYLIEVAFSSRAQLLALPSMIVAVWFRAKPLFLLSVSLATIDYTETETQGVSFSYVCKSKELYILTGMKTRKLFCRIFVTLKKIKELFYPT